LVGDIAAPFGDTGVALVVLCSANAACEVTMHINASEATRWMSSSAMPALKKPND
jgi:hypothetical protein